MRTTLEKTRELFSDWVVLLPSQWFCPEQTHSSFTQRHCPSCRGTRNAVRVRKHHCQHPQGELTQDAHTAESKWRVPCFYWWCIRGKHRKAVRGQAGLAHCHRAVCCNKHLLRGLVQSSDSVSLPQNTDSKHANHRALSPSSLTFRSMRLWAPSHPTQCVCFGCSRCSQSSFQTSLCLLVNQVWSCHSSAKCNWQYHHTHQVLRIYPNLSKEIVEVDLPAVCHLSGTHISIKHRKIWFYLTANIAFRMED